MNNVINNSFIGANSRYGFYSVFQEFADSIQTAYIIKGGPGSGKSSFMRKIGDYFYSKGYNVEKIHCSSDNNSLDGVYVKEKNVCFIDGTAPHTLDSKYPGASGGIVDVGVCWDADKLSENKNEIISLNKQIKAKFESAYKMLAGAGAVKEDLLVIGMANLDFIKINKYINNFSKKYLSNQNKSSFVKKRFASGITPDGYICYNDNFYSKCIVIEDKCFIASVILSKIYKLVTDNGYDCTVFYNPLNPDMIDHINIDEIELSVVTSSKNENIKALPYHKARVSRFLGDCINDSKEKIKFNYKVISELTDEAIKLIKEAKSLHDQLEKYYISAMDFDKVEKMCEQYIEKISR